MAVKKDLIEQLYKEINYLPKEDIINCVDYILDYMKQELSEGKRVEIRRFGSFSLRKRKYSKMEEEYNSLYYRVSKNIIEELNS